MVSDREPRYQLLDSNGTVVGSLYEKSNGKLALQDGNTDTEVVFDGDTIGSGGESLDIDSLASGLKVLDLVDSASGNTVYDSSAEKLGDGNQNADINDLSVSDVQADSVNTDSGTIDGGDAIPGIPTTSTSPTKNFDTWRTPSNSRPTAILVSTSVETDGSTNAFIRILIDEDGGTTADYDPIICHESSETGSGSQEFTSFYAIIPPGASYQVQNDNDPNGNNRFENLQEWNL